jgi:hypothetical protein
LLFFDELSTAPPAVQAALLRVVLERRVGDLRLPDGVRIVAAANPTDSAAGGWDLTPPLANRFVHLTWTHQAAVVADGLAGTWPEAIMPTFDPELAAVAVPRARDAVARFLRARPKLAHQMPATEARRGGAWPSPRSWEMALRLLTLALAADVEPDVRSELLRGTLGDGVALEFLAFLSRLDLPDPEEVLADPLGVELPERPDRLRALLGSVIEAVRADLTEVRWLAGWSLALRVARAYPPDLVVVTVLALGETRQPGWLVPEELMSFGGLRAVLGRAARTFEEEVRERDTKNVASAAGVR